MARMVAIEVRHGLAHDHANDNPRNEDEAVNAGHDPQAQVGDGPVEGDGHERVERDHGGDGQRADNLARGLEGGHDHFVDEVGCEREDDDHADDLEDADAQEGGA